MKWCGIGTILCFSLIFSACTVHPHRNINKKRHKVAEHRKQHLIAKTKSVQIVSIINIGQNH